MPPQIDSYYEHPTHTAGVTIPKARSNTNRVTPTEQQPDHTIRPEALRWFRRDDKVRKCIVLNAAFATFAAGFDTELQPIDETLTEEQKTKLLNEFAYVKAYVDGINRKVNLDRILFIAQIKRSIYGKAAFEIVTDKKDNPEWLLSLQSDKLEPEHNKNWKLTGFKYNINNVNYKPEELLYFVNLGLENDHQGISDIEPIFSQCQSRHDLIKKDIPKITRRLWAPYTVSEANTEGMEDNDEDNFLDELTKMGQGGESYAVNREVKVTVVDMRPDIMGLIALKKDLEQDIISQFGTPRFLLNLPTENRATAYAEFTAYITGPEANIQRDLKRDFEAQWYSMLVKLALKQKKYTGPVPVKISHKWRMVKSQDFVELANAVNALYNNGLGILGDHPELAFEMMGWDKSLLEPKLTPQQKQEVPKSEEQKKEETVKPNGDGT
jgi:hypothetical protein